MRTWRVGTVSMGASLVLLGIFLLYAKFIGLELYPIMMSWWPVILIILGIEILVFLMLNRKENSIVTYDIFSILFIGFLGTVGIGFAIVSSVGIADEVSALISSREETRAIPELHQSLPSEIKRIVVETDSNSLVIEETNAREITLFGTYRGRVSPTATPVLETIEDVVVARQKGDTLYVSLKRLPEEKGWNHSYPTLSANMLVPADVSLEVRGSGNPIVLRPRTIQDDWIIEQASNVSVHLPAESDVVIQALNAEYLLGQNVEWIVRDKLDSEEQGSSAPKDGEIQLGTGAHQINILNANHVSVYTF